LPTSIDELAQLPAIAYALKGHTNMAVNFLATNNMAAEKSEAES